MNSTSALGLAFGVALGVGLWSLAALVPRLGRPRLVNRVAPYLVDVSESARELVSRRTQSPLPVFGYLLAPVFGWVRAALRPIMPSPVTTELRLRQSGSPLSAEDFRSRQLVWGTAGVVAGVLASLILARTHNPPAAFHLVVIALFGIGGFLLRDHMLQRAARARLARITAEMPTILEFLALSLAAGEGVLDSLRRVARTSGGDLAEEFGRVVAAVNSGSPLAESLMKLSSSIALPSLTRCLDQMVGALERGTPLVDVLRSQAQDTREEAKRHLIEVAGRKEVAMMVPLVFLILPTTIAFAIFPGIFVLQLGF